MGHVSRTHRVALDWLLNRINLDPKIQIKYIDTKNQLADILTTEGNFTRVEWNHLFCLFNISHFSSINSVKAMSKITQEDAGEERVTAKSKSMTNLVSRCRVRNPTVLASTASENPENTKSESQNVPLSSGNVQQRGTVRPVMLASSSNSSEWNNDDKWSSQVRKFDEMWRTSTGRPVSNKLDIDLDMDSDTTAESDLSLKPSSFLNKMNDRLRKILDHSSKDAMQDIDKRFTIWWMFMSSTVEASVFMGTDYSENLHSIENTGDNLTLKQMSDISEKLIVGQSDEIFGVSQISWEDSSWKPLSLVNDEEVISLSLAKVYVFSDSVVCFGKTNQNPTSNTVWERQLKWFKNSSQYRTLDTIDGEPMEFEWTISSGLTILELVREVQKFMSKMDEPEQFQGRIIFMSMFKDIIWWNQDNETECIANSTHVSLFAKWFPAGLWSFLGLGLEIQWYSTNKKKTMRKMGSSRCIDDDQFRRKRTPSFPSNESVLSRNAQKQRRWKIMFSLLCLWRYDWNCFPLDHFCQSAHYQRSSLRIVWRMQYLPN